MDEDVGGDGAKCKRKKREGARKKPKETHAVKARATTI